MVDILGYKINDNVAMIAMEKCQANLKELLNNYKSLKEKILDGYLNMIFKNLVHGMAFLHNCNIIHRDIKPSNVLIQMKKNVVGDIDFHKVEDMIFKVNCSSLL